MTYKYYQDRPGTLTAEFVNAEFKKLTDRIPAAEASATSEEWLSLYADWNALSSFMNSETSRIQHAFSKNMADEQNEAREQYQREEVQPIADHANSALLLGLLNSKHKLAIGERYGMHLLRVLDTAKDAVAAINVNLRVKLGALSMTYDKLVAAGEVAVRGETITLSKARSFTSSEDSELRKEAYLAYRKWFLDHHDELAAIYDQMVKLRDEMGRNLGHKNFIPLGYSSMGRTDYGVEQAKTFRDNIRKYVVPVQSMLFKIRAERLGTETLKPWDASYDPDLTLPSNIAPIEMQLDKAQRIFEKISPILAAHFVRMRNEGLIDLENRKGKRAGAYCTSFSDEARVAILCNSTGDSEDIRTLTHEMGHAFQGWESQPIESVDLQWPTSDACEIHSMGMEFLAMRYIDEFFNEELSDKYKRNRWKDAIETSCYIAIVDEFQHWVYENPKATIAERDMQWNKIWDIYKPGIDFTGYEDTKYARWYAQGHIFDMPFYYIDYAIAETGAMQIALMDEADHAKTVDAYIQLCRIGGTKSVLDIFTSVGMRSPFDENLMRDLMQHASKVLAVQESSVSA
ncbi:MAG: M3 family oligoendopeptidase [bacterium]